MSQSKRVRGVLSRISHLADAPKRQKFRINAALLLPQRGQTVLRFAVILGGVVRPCPETFGRNRIFRTNKGF